MSDILLTILLALGTVAMLGWFIFPFALLAKLDKINETLKSIAGKEKK